MNIEPSIEEEYDEDRLEHS